MTLSERTQALIATGAEAYSHGDLTNLLKYANFGKNDPGKDKPGGSWNNIPTRINTALGKHPKESDLLDLVLKILNEKHGTENETEWVQELRTSLFKDGFALTYEERDDSENPWRPSIRRIWSLGPVGAEEVPLPEQYSALRRALHDKGFTVAATHYKQAYDAFQRGEWEASNAATRTTLEGFLLGVAKIKVSYDGTSGGTAIERLRQADTFGQGEHGYLKGFWDLSHNNGSHPGLSSQDEALFRFSAATSAITFFLYRWV